MSESELSCAVVWSDEHMLEAEVRVAFDGWTGSIRAYVDREDLLGFADDLDLVASGARAAEVRLGEPVSGQVSMRVFEYGLARRLAIDVTLVRGAAFIGVGGDDRRDFRLSVPVERGPIPQFAAALRLSVHAERGIARLPVLSS